jgi:uroporphyrinogen-III synthase
MSDRPLSRHRILITRPVSQAADLVRAVEAAGGIAMTFPLLEILPRDAKLVSAEESKLPPPDILIYVSPNAVLHGARWHEPDAMAIAVGPATLGCLKRRGVSEAVSPGGGFDSESLLADAALARVAGKHVRIVRGQDGRELLGETLREPVLLDAEQVRVERLAAVVHLDLDVGVRIGEPGLEVVGDGAIGIDARDHGEELTSSPSR